MQKVHHLVLVDPKQTDPIEPRDRVSSGVEVAQEGVDPPADSSLRLKWPVILPNGSKLSRQSFHKMVGERAGYKHLPHRLRRPRDHDGWGAGIHRPALSPDPTRPVPGGVASFSIQSKAKDKSGSFDWI